MQNQTNQKVNVNVRRNRGVTIEHVGLVSRKDLDSIGTQFVKATGAFFAAVVWASAGLVITAIALGLM